MVVDPWLLGIEWTMAGKRVHQRQGRPWVYRGIHRVDTGELRGARN